MEECALEYLWLSSSKQSGIYCIVHKLRLHCMHTQQNARGFWFSPQEPNYAAVKKHKIHHYSQLHYSYKQQTLKWIERPLTPWFCSYHRPKKEIKLTYVIMSSKLKTNKYIAENSTQTNNISYTPHYGKQSLSFTDKDRKKSPTQTTLVISLSQNYHTETQTHQQSVYLIHLSFDRWRVSLIGFENKLESRERRGAKHHSNRYGWKSK